MSVAERLRNDVDERRIIKPENRDSSRHTYGASTPPTPPPAPGTVVINAAGNDDDEKNKEKEKIKTISDKNIRKLFDPDYDPTAPDDDDAKVGEVGTTDDKDQKTDVNTDPIKIQSGDFIKFLMEDVVLNGFAGWIGGKAAGAVGAITYNVAEWTYHKTMRDPYRWLGKKYHEYKEKREKERVEELKKAAKTWTEENDLKPHENDSERAKFVKKMLRRHNANLEQIEGLSSQYSIDFLIKNIEEGKLEQVKFERLSPELNKALKDRLNMLKEAAPEEREAQLNYLRENLKEALLQEQQIACLASAYAATRMMHEKNKNPDYNAHASDGQLSQEYELYYLNARAKILEQMRNPNFSMDKTIDSFNSMFETEFNNHKKLDQIEKSNSSEVFEVKNPKLTEAINNHTYGSGGDIDEELKSANETCESLAQELAEIKRQRDNLAKFKKNLQKGIPLHTAIRINDNERNTVQSDKVSQTSFQNGQGEKVSLSTTDNKSINITAKDKEGKPKIPSITDFETVFNGLKNKRSEFEIGNIVNDEFKARMIIAAANTGIKITNLETRGAVNHAMLSQETKKALQQKNIVLPQKQTQERTQDR